MHKIKTIVVKQETAYKIKFALGLKLISGNKKAIGHTVTIIHTSKLLG